MFLLLSRTGIRAYHTSMKRRMTLDTLERNAPVSDTHGTDKDASFAQSSDSKFCNRKPSSPAPSYLRFLQTKTPAQVEMELSELVIGQPDLTRAVADFLY